MNSMKNKMALRFVIAAMVIGAGCVMVRAEAPLVPSGFSFVAPSGWSVNSSLSTYSEWAASNTNGLNGTPNVNYLDAGAGLAQPSLSVQSPGFTASSGGYYSPVGDYAFKATVTAPTAGVPVGAGTYLMIQTFAVLGVNGNGTTLGISLQDASNVAIPGVQQLSSTIYGYDPVFPSAFGILPAQAISYEFWIPNYTGNVQTVFTESLHSSVQAVRIDTLLASPGVGDSAPFALTAVPEPASLGLLVAGGVGLLMRRRSTAR